MKFEIGEKTNIVLYQNNSKATNTLDLTAPTSISPIRRGFVNYKKGALDSQPDVIKCTSCFSMVSGSLRLLPPLKLVAMI
jgi:hypothetical protein